MSKKYNINPKQTVYKGVVFRSRLEAKWACMFDELQWQWTYEPSEINGYNPDFIIKTKSKYYDCNNIIVEVKPSVFINEDFIKKTINKYKGVFAHILILDDTPFVISEEYNDLFRIGYGSQYIKDYPFEREEFLMKCVNDFSSMYMIWDGMINGEVERKHFLSLNNTADMTDIHYLHTLWIDCGNKVQFQVDNNKNDLDTLSNLF